MNRLRFLTPRKFLFLGLACLIAVLLLDHGHEGMTGGLATPGAGEDIYLLARAGLLALFVICLLAGRQTVFSPLPGKPPLSTESRDVHDPLLMIRAMACLMVLMGHTFFVIFPPFDMRPSLRAGDPLWLLLSSPWGGVWIFYTLSGYLMGKAFFLHRYQMSGEGFLLFYRNRLYRIVPVYLVVSLVTGILMRPDLFAFDKHGMPGNLVTLLTFDYAAVPIALFATIGTEMHFYALAPFLCLAFIPVADSTSQCII